MNDDPRQNNLTTADLVASAEKPGSARKEPDSALHDAAVRNARETPMSEEEENLAPLFAEDVASDFRSRWDIVQRGFVDDPKASVRAGDELVAQVIRSLAETFSNQRDALEGGQADQASTENLRLALRRYRSFFERLLSI